MGGPAGALEIGDPAVQFLEGLVNLVGTLDQERELAVDPCEPDFEGAAEFGERQGDLSVGRVGRSIRRSGVLYDDDPKSRRRRAVSLPALCIAPVRWHRMRQAAARTKAGERWQASD